MCAVHLCSVSRVTRPPPLSPLQTSPLSELAQRLTVWLTRGTGQDRVKISSNRISHPDWLSNLISLRLFYWRTDLPALEVYLLEFGRYSSRTVLSLHIVTVGPLVSGNIGHSPPHRNARPVKFGQVQIFILSVRKADRSEDITVLA